MPASKASLALNEPGVVANAKLPAVYEQASAALKECERIDECQDWADRAEALASYARQAENHKLRRTEGRDGHAAPLPPYGSDTASGR
jgi:hypothetical protein